MDNTNFTKLLLALLIFLFGVPLADDLAVFSGPLVRLLLISSLLIIGVFIKAMLPTERTWLRWGA